MISGADRSRRGTPSPEGKYRRSFPEGTVGGNRPLTVRIYGSAVAATYDRIRDSGSREPFDHRHAGSCDHGPTFRVPRIFSGGFPPD